MAQARVSGVRLRRSVRAAIWLLASMIVLARPPEVASQAGEGLPPLIIAVDFEGDEAVDERSLREYIPIAPGDRLTQDALERAKRSLERKNVWSRVEPRIVPEGDGVRVVFELEIKRTVASVKVSGYESFYAEDLVRRIRIPSGSALTSETVADAAERLREYYRRRGFPAVRVDVLESTASHRQVDLDFRIDEGLPILVSAVLLEGDSVLPSGEVLESLGVQSGDRFSRGLDREVKRRALEFYRDRNFFDADVDVEWRQDPADERRGLLIVVVRPGEEHEIRFVGNEALSRRRLLDVVALGRRPVITEATWREFERRLTLKYRANGYYRAQVRLRMTRERGEQIIEYHIDEGPRYWVRRIEFVGNDSLPTRLLEEEMRTRVATWVPFSSAGILDDDVLADDLRRIWFLYRRHGFESAEIVDRRIAFDDTDHAIDLTIDVVEGPRSIVERIEFEGFDPLLAIPELRTRAGEAYNPFDTQEDAATLAAAVASRGFPRAEVRTDSSGVRTGAVVQTTVRFLAEPGPFREIGPIVVQNNLITQDRVIERELPFQEGDPFDPQKLIDGQTNVYRLGLFRRVSVRPLDPPEAEAPAVGVEVDERPAGTLSYGFGYETDIGIRVFGEAGYDNVGGLDRRISLRADVSVEPTDPSDSQYVGNLGYRVPRIFDSYLVWRSNAILLRNTQSLNRYSLEGLTLATALEREIWPRFVVGGLVSWEQGDTFDVASDANLAAEGVKDVGFLRQVYFGPFLELDRRDDPFAPREGTIDTLRLRYATPALHSDIGFFSVIGKHAQYLPVTDALVFVYALRGAWTLPFDGKFTVPIRDRYFVGGRTSVRGFEENSIAPLGAQGSPIGGDIMVVGNAELRFPLVFGLAGAVFLDAGGAFLRKECTMTVCNYSELEVENIRRSAGLGLRYITPVGPISLEYGFKLDRRTGEAIGAFHFTIGNIF